MHPQPFDTLEQQLLIIKLVRQACLLKNSFQKQPKAPEQERPLTEESYQKTKHLPCCGRKVGRLEVILHGKGALLCEIQGSGTNKTFKDLQFVMANQMTYTAIAGKGEAEGTSKDADGH